MVSLDLPALIRDREWRELLIYSIIAALAGIYLVCFVLDIKTFSFIQALSLLTEKTLGLNYELWQGHT